jgi:ATP-dependent RNA helicase RhlE
MTSFFDLPISASLKSNLRKHNFLEPTPVQAQAIEPALAGRDLVATAQTGTGKTLAFLLPIIDRVSRMVRERTLESAGPKPSRSQICAVVLTPTRELALQIERAFSQLSPATGVRAACAIGGMSEGAQLKAIRSGAQVLIATPGRLFDFFTRKFADLSAVRILVLDEADRMLDMGFLPVVKRLIAAMPADRQTLLFSATLEASVRHLVETYASAAIRIEIGSTAKPAERVDLHLYEIEQEQKPGLLTAMLREHSGAFLVFVRTKHGADRLAKRLAREGVKAAAIHGDRTQGQRTRALEGFQSGTYRVLVATDVASRGIHVDGIAHVVNFDLPQAPEDFVHRVGRTGRAGAEGTASTFATRSQRADVAAIERALSTRLARRPTPAEALSAAPSEFKHTIPVIVMPPSGSRPRGTQSFRPRFKSKRTGRAVHHSERV